MKTLYENILDSDIKILDDSKKAVAREWMKYAARAYQNKCKEGTDYSIDDDGKISIYGDCTSLHISNSHGTLKKLNPLVKIISLEPVSHCIVHISDADAAKDILPVQMGNYNSRGEFELQYTTSQNLKPSHFPLIVHGNISIREAGDVDLRIMPNLTGQFNIDTKKCKNVRWPAGFPTDAQLIKISR